MMLRELGCSELENPLGIETNYITTGNIRCNKVAASLKTH